MKQQVEVKIDNYRILVATKDEEEVQATRYFLGVTVSPPRAPVSAWLALAQKMQAEWGGEDDGQHTD